MTTAIILIKCASMKLEGINQFLLEQPGVRQVYSVAGNFDLVAIVEASSNELVAQLVTQKIHRLDGVQDTDTMFAFASCSSKDMEAMFDVGNE
ncbi:Lrp/AsnC family transcriptional regulator [Oceanobacter mangrovi]|uniref:Lrp/AsnC family transcriptional regulator n=1 Tax=Oceanobacter mangrovi TaxID=2862510 RepID=UPI001C8E8B00|nr:Lrp/AsnC ligand binding domain-containing protein [Oceanobacter mangrovi]